MNIIEKINNPITSDIWEAHILKDIKTHWKEAFTRDEEGKCFLTVKLEKKKLNLNY